MKAIRTIVIEDEPRSRNLLKGMIQEFCPELELIGEADDIENAIASIHAKDPDLIFLDVNLFGSSGLKVLDATSARHVIFTTAYDQYALDAFKYDACDFLLKPIGPADLKEAISKVKRRMALPDPASNGNSEPKRVALPSLQGLDIEDAANITYIKAEGNYSFIHFSSGKKVLISKSIQHFEDSLDSPDFFRLHKSYIVNLKHVTKYIKGRGGQVVMSDSEIIPVASRRKDEFLSKMSLP